MPLFCCSKCHCVENTALSNYWTRRLDTNPGEPLPPPLCSECDPNSESAGTWHGMFPKKPAAGMLVGEDGFLYTEKQFANRQVTHTKKRGRIGADGQEIAL